MRTTLSIDDDLLEAARSRSRATGQTLGQVVEDALRRALFAEPQDPEPPAIPTFAGGGALQPGVDLSSNRVIAAFLDRSAVR